MTMKIGYLLQEGVPEIRHEPFSGPANHVREICFELMDLGHEVTVLAKINGTIWYSKNLEEFEPVQISNSISIVLRLLKFARRVQYKLKLPLFHFLERLEFAQAVKQHMADCDVYYERAGWTGYGGSAAAVALGKPHFLEINGDHLSELEMLGMLPEGFQLSITKWLTNRSINRSAHVISAGKGWKERLLERWQFPAHKITVVENGSQLVKILNRDHLQAVQAGAEQTEQFNVVYIGAFHTWHGIDVGIKGVAKAISKNSKIRLFLIGSGPEKPMLVELINQLGIADKVDFLGHLQPSEMADYLHKCHVGLSPYCGRVEFSGLKLLDYKAAGLAVIASGADGQPEVIKDGETGYIVTPCDDNELSQKLLKLSQDRVLCQKMGEKARLEAEEQHSWRHAAEQIETIMRQVGPAEENR